jgi:hypothetical protein
MYTNTNTINVINFSAEQYLLSLCTLEIYTDECAFHNFTILDNCRLLLCGN